MFVVVSFTAPSWDARGEGKGGGGLQRAVPHASTYISTYYALYTVQLLQAAYVQPYCPSYYGSQVVVEGGTGDAPNGNGTGNGAKSQRQLAR